MELLRALAVIVEPPTKESAAVAEALKLGKLPAADEYTELFIFQLYPYASVYLGSEGMMGGEALDRIAGFWRALGEMPPTEADHLAVMLALYARLVELSETEGQTAGWQGARKAFLWEHLLSWLPVYLNKLTEIASPFYVRWGATLMEALLAEAAVLGQQESLPLHLRESFSLIDPRTDAAIEEFQQSILTPARYGGILTRADLTRAARHLGIGLRIGERKFTLKALFAQDALGVFDWLIAEASRWRKAHRRNRGMLGAVGAAWEEKARASASLLAELKLAATEVL